MQENFYKIDNENHISLLLDECRGIYIPKAFYNNFNFKDWNINKKDYKELSNPDHELYWNTWQELLENAYFIDSKGLKWTLWQDGSLFAISELYQFDENY